MLGEQASLESEIILNPIEQDMEMYKVTKENLRYRIKKKKITDSTLQQFRIQVIGELIDKRPVFTFYCDDVEFSSADWGSDIFNEVAKHILKLRKNNDYYYLYITDLELSPALLGKSSSLQVQTIELLQYKRKIEGKLNKTLRDES